MSAEPVTRPLAADGRPVVEVTSRAQLAAWLADNHATCTGAWVVTLKKAAGAGYLAYDDVVLELLRHGWVDSRSRAVDARRTSLLCTPRAPRSAWSASNRDRIRRLEAEGSLTAAGRAAVAAARAAGTWGEA